MSGSELVRSEDPETAHEAADHIQQSRAVIRQRVLELFRVHGAMTDHTLYEHYRARYGPVPYVTPAKRRCELRDLGLVTDSGLREPLPTTKRRAIVWQLLCGGVV